jgi:tRNA(Ile)-lysidine synthase
MLNPERRSGRVFNHERFSIATYGKGLILETKATSLAPLTFYFMNDLKRAFRVNDPSNLIPENHWSALFPERQLAYPLVLRPWQDGDTIHPLGMNGRSKKLKDVMTDKKIPSLLKKKVMVLEDVRGMILWAPGVVRSDHLKLEDGEYGILLTLKEELAPFPMGLF